MSVRKFPTQIVVDSDYSQWDSEKEAAENGVVGPVAIYKLVAKGKLKTVFVKDGGSKGE